MKKSQLKQLIIEEVQTLVRENISNFTSVGMPADFAKNLLRTFRVKHDAELTPISGRPKAADIENGDMFISILPNGEDVVGFTRYYPTNWGSADYYYIRFQYMDGKFSRDGETRSLKEAMNGMNFSNMFKLEASYLSPMRGTKPTDDQLKDRFTDDPLAGSDSDIYSYMNKTFLPGIKSKIEDMVDGIYSNLRKLGKDRRWLSSRTEQEKALYIAKTLENIAEKGFTRDTMARFLQSLDKYVSTIQGIGQYGEDEKSLRKVLKTVPNARAKWAQVVLKSAKAYYNDFLKMLDSTDNK